MLLLETNSEICLGLSSSIRRFLFSDAVRFDSLILSVFEGVFCASDILVIKIDKTNVIAIDFIKKQGAKKIEYFMIIIILLLIFTSISYLPPAGQSETVPLKDEVLSYFVVD